MPTVDGEFLVEEPLECLKKGKIYDIPTIVGVTSDEGFLMHYCEWIIKILSLTLASTVVQSIFPPASVDSLK